MSGATPPLGRPTVLTADVGTSSLKAALYDDAGRVLQVAVRRYGYETPEQGWAEGDPEAWWAMFCDACRELLRAGYRLDHIDAIAFTGQMHSAVLLDAANEVIPPTILWLDRRADKEMEELAGLLRMPPYELNSTYTLPKLRWLSRHRPDVTARVRTILWPKDYLRFRLTGEIATDLTECGGAALLDWSTRTWAVDRLPLIGLDPSVLPPVLPADAIAGSPAPAVAEALGLNPHARVVVGVGDVAALIGGAPPRPGRAVCSLGSSSMTFMALGPEQQASDPAGRLYVYPLLPPYRLAGGVSSTTGAALVWIVREFLAKQFVRQKGSPVNFEQAVQAAVEVEAGADGLVFIPYLAGERSPYWSDQVRGGFYGLRLSHDVRHATRAVMEGIAFSLRHLLDIYREMDLPVAELVLAGGGAKTPGLAQIIADACGRDVAIYAAEETVTRVLFALAQQALGRDQLAPALERTFDEPHWVAHRPDLKSRYDACYMTYRRFSDFAAGEALRAHSS